MIEFRSKNKTHQKEKNELMERTDKAERDRLVPNFSKKAIYVILECSECFYF